MGGEEGYNFFGNAMPTGVRGVVGSKSIIPWPTIGKYSLTLLF